MLDSSPLAFSVVICAYSDERWDDLLAAIASVREQHLRPEQIIVVIDHNPGLLDRLQQVGEPGITLIPNSQQRGLSGARNSGIAAARGDVIAFLDDDAMAAPDWLRWLAEGYADKSVLGVGGDIQPLWLADRPVWFPEEFNWVIGCSYRGMPTATAPVRNLLGANMSLRSEVFAAIGGFRHGMGRIGKTPLGCEETELCIRAVQRWPGSQFLYEPRATVRHRVPQARANWTYFRSRCYAEGLSKAQVARLVGPQNGLASERAYTTRTLPAAVVRGLAELAGRDAGGLRRAAAVIGGLAWTVMGYLRGALAGTANHRLQVA